MTTSHDTTLDVHAIRQDFPALHQTIKGNPLVYLDNAATTQKPQSVIDAVAHHYQHNSANVHRGIHTLSERATAHYEAAREKVQHFIRAQKSAEIIFVRGSTEAINLVAQSYARPLLKAGDEIIISAMEHHSNIVPWQLVCEQTGAVLKVIPINQRGELVLEVFKSLLSERTRLVSIVHISNSLGTLNPIKTIIDQAHAFNVPVLIDGAQACAHTSIDVQALDCDFYTCSGHKMLGPTGIGVLYGKEKLLEQMPPYQGGGEMISQVSFSKTTYNVLPHKFEAGTPNIAGTIGLGAAIDYINNIGLNAIRHYEHQLLQYAEQQLEKITDLSFIGTAREKASIVSFVLDAIHPHDIGTILNEDGIAIRSGHHCTMPIMDFFKIPATTRASFAFYNTRQEIDLLATSLLNVKKVFAHV